MSLRDPAPLNKYHSTCWGFCAPPDGRLAVLRPSPGQLAPETCELIKTRPEINECKFMNVNYDAWMRKELDLATGVGGTRMCYFFLFSQG